MDGFLGFTVTPGSFGFLGGSAGGVTKLSEQCSAFYTTPPLDSKGTKSTAPVGSVLEKLVARAVVLNASP